MGLEEPGLRLTRRQALTGLGGLGAAALLVTGRAARDPAGHALMTAAARRAVHPPGTLLWHVRVPGIASLVVADGIVCAGVGDSSATGTGAYALWSHAIPAYPVFITTAAGVAYVVAERDPLTDQSPSEVYAFQA